jgi:hypothetical protein
MELGLLLLLIRFFLSLYYNNFKALLIKQLVWLVCFLILFFWKAPSARYPVVVRFDKVNYAGISTNNYALDEIVSV